MKDEIIEDYCDEVSDEDGKPALVLQEGFNPFTDEGELGLMDFDDDDKVILIIQFLKNIYFENPLFLTLSRCHHPLLPS